MKILVTGATSGIGEQLVRDYASAGHSVIGCGRNREKLDSLAELEGVTSLQFDVTDREQCRAVLHKVSDLDLVILSAGVCEYIDDAQHFDAELVERVFAANFFGMVNCAEALLPNMQAGSRLVFIDSMSRLIPFTRAQAYGASKAAIHYFAQSLGGDLQPKGIDVVTVSPGFVETPMTDANDFDMPMRVSVTEASQALRKQLQKRRQSIYFPQVFGWILRFVHKLPTAILLRVAQRLKS